MSKEIKSKQINIRPADQKDFDGIWRIFKAVVADGNTYVNRPGTTKEEAYAKWMDKNVRTYVAVTHDKIVGAYLLRNNHVDLGSHIGNCSYIVDADTRGMGVGKALGLHSIETAKKFGYRGIQFNFVVSTNEVAVKLWKSIGFRIIGITPGGFRHKDLGYVDSYIMFQEL